MRQAGRALPEYRALKEKHTFLELVRTPELAAEVTLQPIERYGFDAAILFSDILVIPEALGQGYHFREQGGIEMDFALNSQNAIRRLDASRVRERLEYTSDALKLIKQKLGNETGLLGFAGSPWTLANFMIEGGSAKEFTKARQLLYTQPWVFQELSEKLTEAVSEYLQLQIDSGVDAIQIFDSLGGLLAADAYAAASARWIKEIIRNLRGQVPIIVFGKGVHGNWLALRETGADAFAVDWTVSLAELRQRMPANIALQGNLDPIILTTDAATAARETTRLLESMRGSQGFIMNLGHGLVPGSKLECIEALVTTVQNFQ
jgi:uroporphyrinogen decarboxylase